MVADARPLRPARERSPPPARGDRRRGVDDRPGRDGPAAASAARRSAPAPAGGQPTSSPSVEAGAVFRDLCAGLGATRLATNLRVARDPGGERLVEAAAAVNAGAVDARFSAAVAKRRSVEELEHVGVEHLDGTWAALAEPLLEAWWKTRVASLDDFARRTSRLFSLHDGAPADEDLPEIRALFEHHTRSRILCATRGRAFSSGAEAINDALLARLRGRARPRRWRRPELAPGTPSSSSAATTSAASSTATRASCSAPRGSAAMARARRRLPEGGPLRLLPAGARSWSSRRRSR